MTANDLETALGDQASSMVHDRERLHQELHFLHHCARVSHVNAQMQFADAQKLEQAARWNSFTARGLSETLQTAQAELAKLREEVHASRAVEQHGAEMLTQFKVQLGNDMKMLCQQLAKADSAASTAASRTAQRIKDCAVARGEATSEASLACSATVHADEAEEARDALLAEAAARDKLSKVGALSAMRSLEEDFNQERWGLNLKVPEEIMPSRLLEVLREYYVCVGWCEPELWHSSKERSMLRARQKLRQTRLQELELLVNSRP